MMSAYVGVVEGIAGGVDVHCYRVCVDCCACHC